MSPSPKSDRYRAAVLLAFPGHRLREAQQRIRAELHSYDKKFLEEVIVYSWPAYRLQPLPEGLEQLAQYLSEQPEALLILSSVFGAKTVCQQPSLSERIGGHAILTVGPSVSRVVEEDGRTVYFQAQQEFSLAALIEDFTAIDSWVGRPVLLIGSADSQHTNECARLYEAGALPQQIAIYRSEALPATAERTTILQTFQETPAEKRFVYLSSPHGVDYFAEQAGEPAPGGIIVCLGAKTAQQAQRTFPGYRVLRSPLNSYESMARVIIEQLCS